MKMWEIPLFGFGYFLSCNQPFPKLIIAVGHLKIQKTMGKKANFSRHSDPVTARHHALRSAESASFWRAPCGTNICQLIPLYFSLHSLPLIVFAFSHFPFPGIFFFFFCHAVHGVYSLCKWNGLSARVQQVFLVLSGMKANILISRLLCSNVSRYHARESSSLCSLDGKVRNVPLFDMQL